MISLRFFGLLQLLIVAYLLISVFYTTSILVAPLYHLLKDGSTRPGISESGSSPSASQPSGFSPRPVLGDDALMNHFNISAKFPGQEGLPWSDLVDESVFLSKLFSQSMHPSDVVPFFYRASGRVDKEDITITTLITSNRLDVFKRMVEAYRGPISVAIHVRNETAHVHSFLDTLHSLYTSSSLMSTFVDVHLVIDSFDRQFNTWRNIARLFSRTDFVMMLDVDFAICTNFRSSIRNSPAIMDKLREGHAAFVVPAFEYVKQKEGTNHRLFPRDKQELLSQVKSGRLDVFHRSWAPGHNSTDYTRFYSAQPGQVYKVTRYQSAYEPYVIFKKEGPPWCDERFVGYGGNKAACLFEMYLSGISFYVLADHFVIHQSHRYEEETRKDERKYNKRLYGDFKEETCLRYLKRFRDQRALNKPEAYNAQDECRKIKGLSRITSQLIEGRP